MTVRGFKPPDLIAIAIGGTAGASLRWLLTRSPSGPATPPGSWFEYGPNVAIDPGLWADFPTATLLVNVIGCATLGLVFGLRRTRSASSRTLVAVAVGFCGSLTTFSTFAVEVASSLQHGAPLRALMYSTVSIAAGAIAFVAGRDILAGAAR